MVTKEQLTDALIARHGAENQQKLSASTVGIAGLGGLGSNIAVALARLGVGRLVLADFDAVDITNLNRQHYFIRHLGRPKAEALREQLMEINPYLQYEAHTVRVTADNACTLFAGCDVICEAFDRADQKAMLAEAVLTGLPDTPLVSGSGMAGWGSANAIQTVRRFGHFYVCGDGESDIADGVGLTAPRVAVCAAHQATMVMRLLLGQTNP
ncbi:MAG: sulfur carrier protein ThiS adenylyltransferase ThiF [Butyricicoccus sp.]|nr:sulfur carrier protein ThiS adenylyltransferase ThiF [Butyricicoccus sp.]